MVVLLPDASAKLMAVGRGWGGGGTALQLLPVWRGDSQCSPLHRSTSLARTTTRFPHAAGTRRQGVGVRGKSAWEHAPADPTSFALDSAALQAFTSVIL